MIYGYARCSTNEKKQDVSRQIRELTAMGVAESNIFLEYESGNKIDRAQLQRMLAIVQEGDTIMATEISRLSRSTRQLCDLIDLVKSRHLCLSIKGSITVDCRTADMDPISQAFLEITAVFATLERNMTIARVKSGLQNAKAKGVKLGRPITTVDDIPDSFWRYYAMHANGQISVTELARLAGLSRTTVYKYMELCMGQKK